MKPPDKPKEEDCCNSGCNPCIFDIYDKQLKIYEKFKISGEDAIETAQNGISDMEYTSFVITDILQLNYSQIILKFKHLHQNGHVKKVWWNPGDHFLLRYTSQENVSCTRAYTPIKLKSDVHEDYEFLIVVKRYNHALVSNYLFNLKIGEVTKWRGPYGFYKMELNKYSRIIMIAQGTGIAPFMSIMDEILSNEEELTRIVLFFCCKNIEEILFRKELYDNNSYWNFSYKIFLSCSTDDNQRKLKYQEPILFSRFNVKCLDYLKPFTNNQIMLCGSVQFMEEIKSLISYDLENVILF